jgi:hypothetical protein
MSSAVLDRTVISSGGITGLSNTALSVESSPGRDRGELVRSAECGVQSAECRVQSAECRVQSGERSRSHSRSCRHGP